MLLTNGLHPLLVRDASLVSDRHGNTAKRDRGQNRRRGTVRLSDAAYPSPVQIEGIAATARASGYARASIARRGLYQH